MMLPVDLQPIVFGIGFASALIYLACLLWVIALLKEYYPDHWKRMGSPSFFDTKSMRGVFTKIVLGRDMPAEAASRYRMQLLIMRASCALCFVTWAFLIVTIWQGQAATK